jgi:NitT/TauT family transport system substrate-binding protein
VILTLFLSLVMVIVTACGGGGASKNTGAASSPAAASGGSGAPAATKAPEPAKDLEKVSIRLDFVLNGYHAPFYVAAEKGYYKAEGLDVSIKEGKGSGVSVQNVDSGADTFAFADGGVLMSFVSKGAKSKAVAGVLRTNGSAIIYLDNGKFKDPKDAANMKVGGAPGSAPESLYPAFLQAIGADPNKNPLRVLESSSKLQALMDGKVDGVTSFAFFQIPILESKGFKAKAFLFADHGINTPSLSIIASQKTIDTKPDMVKAFLRATEKGFKDSQANPDEAIAILKKVSPQIDEKVFKQALVGSFPLFESKGTAGKPWGFISEEEWTKGEELVQKYIGLDKVSGGKAYFTNDFLPQQ